MMNTTLSETRVYSGQGPSAGACGGPEGIHKAVVRENTVAHVHPDHYAMLVAARGRGRT